MNSTLKIFCFMNTVPDDFLVEKIFKDDTIVPVYTGAISQKIAPDFKYYDRLLLDNDYVGNISNLNTFACEFTGIHAIFNKLDTFKNVDYIGLCHYRRFFKPEDQTEYYKYDVMTVAPNKFSPYSIYEAYKVCHVIKDFDDAMVAIDMPQFQKQAMIAYFNDRLQIFKQCNMFIMRRSLFQEYCNFIFKVLNEIVEAVPVERLVSRAPYQQRAWGFILERFTSFWIDYKVAMDCLRHKNVIDIDFYKDTIRNGYNI